MDSEVVVVRYQVVVVIVGPALYLEALYALNAVGGGGEVNFHPSAIVAASLENTKVVVRLMQRPAILLVVAYLVWIAFVCDDPELLLATLVIEFASGIFVVAELELDGGVLGAYGAVVLALEAAEIVHHRVLVVVGERFEAIAWGDVFHKHVAPVLAASSIRVVTLNGASRQWRHKHCHHQDNLK